jgi:hypothetical protein
MKLKVARPHPAPYQRRDTGKWIAYGTIAVHNDSEYVSCDLQFRGPECDSKESAIRTVIESADMRFVMRCLDSGAAAQLRFDLR